MANNSNQPLTADNLEAHNQNHDDEDGNDGQRRAQMGTARRGSVCLDPETENHMNDASYLEYINSPDRWWNMHKRTGSGSSCALSLNSIEFDESEDLKVNTTDNRSRDSDDDLDQSEVDESFDNDKTTKHAIKRRESVVISPANDDHDESEEEDDSSIEHPTEITKTSPSSPGENEGELGDDITAQPTVSNTAQNNWPKPLVMIIMMVIILYGLFIKYQQMISHVQHKEAEKANMPYTDNIKVSKMSAIDEYFCDAVFNGSENVYNYLMEDDNVWQYE